MWAVLLPLVTLLLFILWDGHRIRNAKPIARSGGKPKDPWIERTTLRAKLCIGMGGAAGLMAIIEWQNPTKPPFTGKSAWLFDLAFGVLGDRGPFGFLVLAGLLLVCIGLFLWHMARSRSKS